MDLTIEFRKIRVDQQAFAPVKNEQDSDYDLFTCSDVMVKPGQTEPILTNIAIKFPSGWEGKIEEKSGLGLKGISVLGGVIDEGYRGEIIVIIHNLGKVSKLFKTGEKVAQLRLRPRSPNFVFKETSKEFEATERNTGGFGSTGA